MLIPSPVVFTHMLTLTNTSSQIIGFEASNCTPAAGLLDPGQSIQLEASEREPALLLISLLGTPEGATITVS